MSSLIFLVFVFLSITIHEYAHGIAAYKLGDTTPQEAGRLTLNPLAHIDIFGTIILPIILQLTIHMPFGYAKPIPINPYNFKDPKKDTMWVGLAGPAANIIAAIALSLIVRFIPLGEIYNLLLSVIAVNITLAIFNLIPIPPLDGSRIVATFLPARWYHNYLKLQIYGVIIILTLSITGFFDYFLMPVLNTSFKLMGLGGL